MRDNLTGPARAARIAANREQQVRKLKQDRGKPVVGYLCCFAPPEMISAAGAIPYRLSGRPGDSTAKAEAYMEPYGCTYVRNILARAVKGSYDFLDGLVISHSCDMVQRLYGIWTYYRPPAYSRLFNVPHQLTPWAQRFFKRELAFFRESLENFTGRRIAPARLKEEIARAKRNRALVRKLYGLRLQNPPPLKGSEMLDLLIAGGALPAEDFTGLLEESITVVENREPQGSPGPRLLVWGSILDDSTLYRMIEETGGTVAADDTCIGFRTWEKDIPVTGDPEEGLKEHYFVNFQCPRTDRGPGSGRFSYILERARLYGAEAVIGYIISFCDPHKFDYPDLRDRLKEAGLPVLLIDDDYSFSPAGAIKTRLQTFMEMLRG